MPISNTLRTFLFETNLLSWILLASMFLMIEIGWRLGRFFTSKYGIKKVDASETFMAAIFGLLALLLAITFSGASDRFDKRRDLIAKEVSSIGTAYQSVDLLPLQYQIHVKDLFKKYLDSRIEVYQGGMSEIAINQRFDKQTDIGNQLWQAVVLAVKNTAPSDKLIAGQILPEVSDMFDASANQRLAMKFHPPPIIWQALISLALVGSLVAGYNLGIEQKRDWFLTIIFTVLMVGTIVVILNLEYPRIGMVKLDDFDVELINLRKSF